MSVLDRNMAVTTTRVRGSRSACDRCYQLKERCERASTASSCERCERLKQPCLSVRPVKPMGRQKVRRKRTASKTILHQSTDGSFLWPQGSLGLSCEEKDVLLLLLGDPKSLQYPVVSPRFQAAEQKSFSGPLPAAWSILKDAYLAYAGVLKSLQPDHSREADVASKLRYATSAMISLRNLSISTPRDAELCLTLGFALALSVYGAIGVGVADICHYCLDITKPFIEAATIGPETDSRISVLVLLEIMECMVHRRKPTLRIQPRAPRIVDRYLGLCLPLLPYYHDICNISHSLVNNTDASHLGLLNEQLESIQANVERWQPPQPDRFLQDFHTAEVIQLLAQAKVYRLAALLAVHRLRYRFGDEDTQADIWSHEVMMELELAQNISNHPVRFVALPFIIAAVETRDPAERDKVLQSVDQHVDQLTPVVQQATRTFLSRVWHERDVLPGSSWLNSIHKPCVVLDSIKITFSGYQLSI